MTSRQHQLWINRGRPARLCRPLIDLRDTLRAEGYTVYDIGNDAHLDHEPPEDHTPYSETGWPQNPAPYGVIFAIDIMPPAKSSGLPSLQAIGGRLYADRMAGAPAVAWLKYMNWGPDSDSRAVQDRWKPSHARVSSSDTGHIHLSARTDYADSNAAAGYNPARPDTGGITVSDSPLVANAERGITALIAGYDPIQFDYPWNDDVRKNGLANPFNRMFAELGDIKDAVAALQQQSAPAAAPQPIDYDALAAALLRQMSKLSQQ